MFVPLQWDRSFETGIEEVDAQHRYFLHLVNRLGQELDTARDENYRSRLIRELFKYAEFHFLSEENLMMRHGFPGLPEHRDIHRQLIEDLSGQLYFSSLESLLRILTDWFLQHSVTEDRAFGEFVRQQALDGG